MVLVQRAIHGRDLALAEGVVKGVVEGLGAHPKTAGGVAVDHELGLQTVILLVSVHVGEHAGEAFELLQQQRRPLVEVFKILALDRVLILSGAKAAADGEVLRCLQKKRGPGHGGQFTAFAIDHGIGGHIGTTVPEMGRLAGVALLERLEHDEEAALV